VALSSTTQIAQGNWNLQLRVQLRFLTGFPINPVHECEQDNHNFDTNIVSFLEQEIDC